MLLKNWRNENSVVCCHKYLVPVASVPDWKHVPSGGTGYRNHLYKQKRSETRYDELEDWFNEKIENPAAPAIEKIITDSLMTVEDWHKVIKFAVLQQLRTPAAFFDHVKTLHEVLPVIQRDVLAEAKEKLERGELSIESEEPKGISKQDYPCMFSTIQDEETDTVTIKLETAPGRSTWLFDIKNMIDKIFSHAKRHKWTVIKPSKGFNWPINDLALIRLSFKNAQNYTFGGGWDNPNGNLILPLSPQHLMITQIKSKSKMFKRGQRVDLEMTNLIRKIIAESAFEFIYSKNKDDDLLKYRKRLVDLNEYNLRKKFWKKWDTLQSGLEDKFVR